jgi:hypothetical protein
MADDSGRSCDISYCFRSSGFNGLAELLVPFWGFSIPNIFCGTFLKGNNLHLETLSNWFSYCEIHNLIVESIKNRIGYFFEFVNWKEPPYQVVAVLRNGNIDLLLNCKFFPFCFPFFLFCPGCTFFCSFLWITSLTSVLFLIFLTWILDVIYMSSSFSLVGSLTLVSFSSFICVSNVFLCFYFSVMNSSYPFSF